MSETSDVLGYISCEAPRLAGESFSENVRAAGSCMRQAYGSARRAGSRPVLAVAKAAGVGVVYALVVPFVAFTEAHAKRLEETDVRKAGRGLAK